jgi:hypothetical protein
MAIHAMVATIIAAPANMIPAPMTRRTFTVKSP